MRLAGRRGSVNVEDRRGARLPGGMPALGCGGLILVLGIAWLTGADPGELLSLLGEVSETAPADSPAGPIGAPEDELGRFASVVLADTETTWGELFAGTGGRYEEPTLVLFTHAVQSACGRASASVGPFYCPPDRKVYLDLSFFDELSRRFGAPGDFAGAYVIAHEIGHHVQNLAGTSDAVRERQRAAPSREEANAWSVRLELQADCYAGVWGHHAQERGLIEPGDFEEGLRAAAAIGDDRLQRLGRGEVQPDSFTHGSSDQRVEWLRRGLASGNPSACATF
ncbi:MAG TPA: neutral zinc metallopeptidase [Candidatus Polarisedimenticolaceae bacterium]